MMSSWGDWREVISTGAVVVGAFIALIWIRFYIWLVDKREVRKVG